MNLSKKELDYIVDEVTNRLVEESKNNIPPSDILVKARTIYKQRSLNLLRGHKLQYGRYWDTIRKLVANVYRTSTLNRIPTSQIRRADDFACELVTLFFDEVEKVNKISEVCDE